LDGSHQDRAEFKSCEFELDTSIWSTLGFVDESLASFESTFEDLELLFTDKVVLISKSGVTRVLGVRVGETISNGDGLQVKFKIRDFIEEVVSDSGNVMSGVALSSDEEISSLKLRVLVKETLKEGSHIFSDGFLGLHVLLDSSFRVASSNGLIDVKQVCVSVPSMGVGIKVVLSIEVERSILVEKSDF